MSLKKCNNCIVCSKTVKNCHKDIFCKLCKGFVHKKCTKLKPPKEFQCLKNNEWVCQNCNKDALRDSDFDIEDDINKLNESPEFKITNIAFQKYDDMIFNPLRFDFNSTNKAYNDVANEEFTHKCPYVTPEQFGQNTKESCGKLNLLNVNIRSLSKNFESLKECLKTLNCEFSVIGISETHLKDKPNDFYNIPGFNVEYTNRIDREKGGVCLFIADQIKYKLRSDLCKANSSFESCFIEIEGENKNTVIGVVYRSHTHIDNFIRDIDPIFKKLNSEKKTSLYNGGFQH